MVAAALRADHPRTWPSTRRFLTQLRWASPCPPGLASTVDRQRRRCRDRMRGPARGRSQEDHRAAWGDRGSWTAGRGGVVAAPSPRSAAEVRGRGPLSRQPRFSQSASGPRNWPRPWSSTPRQNAATARPPCAGSSPAADPMRYAYRTGAGDRGVQRDRPREIGPAGWACGRVRPGAGGPGADERARRGWPPPLARQARGVAGRGAARLISSLSRAWPPWRSGWADPGRPVELLVNNGRASRRAPGALVQAPYRAQEAQIQLNVAGPRSG